MDRLKTGFAFLGGALAWTMHLMGTYLVSETACRAVLVPGGQAILFSTLGVLTLGCLILATLSLQVGRKLAYDQQPISETHVFVGRTSLWTNGLFLLVIAAQTLPLFLGALGC